MKVFIIGRPDTLRAINQYGIIVENTICNEIYFNYFDIFYVTSTNRYLEIAFYKPISETAIDVLTIRDQVSPITFCERKVITSSITNLYEDLEKSRSNLGFVNIMDISGCDYSKSKIRFRDMLIKIEKKDSFMISYFIQKDTMLATSFRTYEIQDLLDLGYSR